MRIKICCIQSVDEARLACDAGANLLGLVSKTLSGVGAIPDEIIREVADSVPSSATPCLLTLETDPNRIADHIERTRTKAVQLVGPINAGEISALRTLIPGTPLIKVIHVEGPSTPTLAASYFEAADILLLDSAIRGPQSDLLGGTGRTHDWRISRRIIEASPLPVYLAGGLDPENVTDAIDAARPAGVDVCSALRKGGTLDSRLLSDFVTRAKSPSTDRLGTPSFQDPIP